MAGVVNRSISLLVSVRDAASQVFGRLQASLDSLLSSSNLLTAAFEAMVGGAIAEGVEHLVGLFADEELAVVRLNAALRFTGRYSDDATDAIQKMAAQIQATTTVSRVQFIELSSSIAQIARQITPEQVAEVAKMAIGLSEATGRSVENTAIMIAKTLEGHTNALQRWGIQVDATASQQEKFQELFRQLAPMFGVALEAADTLSGQIERAKNAFTDMERVIGQVIVQVLGLDEKSKTITSTLVKWTQEIRNNFGEWVHYGEVVVAVLEAVFASVKYLVTGFFDIGKIAGDAFAVLIEGAWDSVKILFNIGAVIGDSINYAFNWVSSKWVDFDNWLIDQVNKLLLKLPDKVRSFFNIQPFEHLTNEFAENLVDNGKRIQQHLTDIKSDFVDLGASAQIHLADAKKALDDLNSGAIDFATAWERVTAALAKPAPGPTRSVSGTPSHEGGGSNFAPPELPSATDVIAELGKEQKENENAFKAGLITWDQYNAKIKELRTSAMELFPELTNLKDKLDLSGIIAKLKGENLGDTIRRAFGLDQASALDDLKKTNEELGKQSKAIGTDMTQAIMDSIAAHGKFGETVQKEVGKAAAAYAKLDFAHALEELAAGIAALFINPGASAAHFQAAETYAVAGAAMGAIAGATGGFAGGGGGAASNAASQTQAVTDLAGGNVVINVPNTFTSDPAFWDALLGGLEQAGLRRITVTSQG
jgi:phage shock protein A/CRISPR/Cas system CSM-associated protein Csm2 small subunit